MNPLPPLALLATHVNHQHFMIPQIEARFCDADCPSPALNDVLLVGKIMGFEEPFQIRKVIVQAVLDAGDQGDRGSGAVNYGTHFSGSAASLPLEQAF